MSSLQVEVIGVVVAGMSDSDYIADKTYKGRPVRALLVGRIRSVRSYVAPARVLADMVDKTIATMPEEVQAKIRAVFQVCYVRENLCWSDGDRPWGTGEFYPKFQAAWNSADGDPDKCSELIGVNDWGEEILPRNQAIAAYKNAVKLMPNSHGLVDMTNVKIGRGKSKLDPKSIASAIVAELGLMPPDKKPDKKPKK
jgi:hypothetical protein